MSTVLFLLGYPVAILVIVRWVPVVREQRWAWFLTHQAAVVAIVAGHALLGNGAAVAVNATWFVVAAAWFGGVGLSRRRQP